jgi:hypothetical protein
LRKQLGFDLIWGVLLYKHRLPLPLKILPSCGWLSIFHRRLATQKEKKLNLELPTTKSSRNPGIHLEGMPTADAAGSGDNDDATTELTEGTEFFKMMQTRKEFLSTAAPHQVTVNWTGAKEGGEGD